MPFIGTGHIWIIAILLIIVLIIWGPGKLPDVGSGMGRAIREFRKASNDTREEFARATRQEEPPVASAPPPPPVPVAEPTVTVAPVVPVQTAPVGGGATTPPPIQGGAGGGDHITTG